jgi:TATA-binding protein-associated factor Taf7
MSPKPWGTGRSKQMTRADRQALERKLEQTRRLALEPTDPLTRERLAQKIEELEFQLWLKVA